MFASNGYAPAGRNAATSWMTLPLLFANPLQRRRPLIAKKSPSAMVNRVDKNRRENNRKRERTREREREEGGGEK